MSHIQRKKLIFLKTWKMTKLRLFEGFANTVFFFSTKKLCFSKGEFPFPSDVPLTLGHEFSGFVYQTGTSASHLKIGTRVAINPNKYLNISTSNSQFFLPIYCFSGCKTCKVCLDGNYHFCQKGSLRTTIGIGRNGSFAKFCIVPLEQVYLIPDSVTLEQGALCEPLSCILRGTVFENHMKMSHLNFRAKNGQN